jgi:hypothetical protein
MMSKVRYSTNWMGPINKAWYENRNLELWTYSAGRIDVRGGDTGRYGTEIDLDPMTNEDWYQFSEWLKTFETDDVWRLEDLVELYERANPKITWCKE